MSRSPNPSDETQREAQAALDQIRVQAGGALSGSELNARIGRAPTDDDAPPLDWRLTPRNIILQLAAILVFGAVVWFLGALVYDGLRVLFT